MYPKQDAIAGHDDSHDINGILCNLTFDYGFLLIPLDKLVRCFSSC
jgi:hypothetical protein